jgi:hypothetical protein
LAASEIQADELAWLESAWLQLTGRALRTPLSAQLADALKHFGVVGGPDDGSRTA